MSGTVFDIGGSGIDVSTVTILIDLNSDGDFLDAGEVIFPSVIGTDGDTTITFSTFPPALNEGEHVWQMQATDIAGNLGMSDSDTGIVGDQVHTITVDLSPPFMSAAETGRWWDNTAFEEKSNKLDALVVIFNEDIEPASVSISDFTVEGVAPAAAQMFAMASQQKVYLTLTSDLGIDDTPLVAIATGGSISDKAGNSINVNSITADDKITAVPTPVPGVSGPGLAIMAGLLAVAFIWAYRRRYTGSVRR